MSPIMLVCGCGAVLERRPCRDCERRKNRERGSGWTRYGRTWRRNQAEAIRRHPLCAECGSIEDLTGDHTIPKTRGGTDRLENIQVLCRSCNSIKGTKTKGHATAQKNISGPTLREVRELG